MKAIQKTIFITIIIFFTACSVPSMRYNHELTNTDFDGIVTSLLEKASHQIFPHMGMNEVLLVTNFAETTTLRSNTKLSFLLSDLMKNKLVSKYSYTIREIETAKNFKFGDEGFRLLTRDKSRINNKVIKSRYAVVGTYTVTKNQLILFLKLINIRNGLVMASSSYSANLTQEIEDTNKIILQTEQPIYQPMTL